MPSNAKRTRASSESTTMLVLRQVEELTRHLTTVILKRLGAVEARLAKLERKGEPSRVARVVRKAVRKQARKR